ncbi:beta-lactamase class A [Vreelandella songnenensis]|uniref:beta-lactamase n=1 Tax=Vreelandella songnenensis TaxID=1176243 RepID=A0A2T0V231_9GAMM|nr:serine hydrolase [Halomonas songnenensis]PRY64239.1 beta-lactamase class A [Halomonas songnenensis]
MRLLTCWCVGVALILAMPFSAVAQEVEPSGHWQQGLNDRMAAIEEGFGGELGVYVQDLATGDAYSWRADQPWYLASLVKIPIAAQVLAERQAGTLTLDQRLTLAQSDFVDGAGPVIWHEPGTRISIRYLLEQMITVSDNTASDMLINRVGLDAVNARARAMVAAGGGKSEEIGPITRLVGVRQGVYGQLHPDARTLGGMDFIALRRNPISQRPAALAQLLGVSPAALHQPDYDHAYDAYEASGENVGTLRAYGGMLASLEQGGQDDLNATQRETLLEIMRRTRSGEQRLKAGLGEGVSFAHKTGTQHRRSCDAGIASREEVGADGPWVVVACSRGPIEISEHEHALARVGAALRESGAIGTP